ncbi:hypothetical protein EV560_101920 [Bosea sp. BK604]|nr:hypothetical protein EV560_101920 [Bosea sp. BK604]
MLDWSETAPRPPEGPAPGHRTFNSGFKKIWLARERKQPAAVLSHLWGSRFNGR